MTFGNEDLAVQNTPSSPDRFFLVQGWRAKTCLKRTDHTHYNKLEDVCMPFDQRQEATRQDG